MTEDQSDKQFDPTEQKLRKAREKGDIPRSTEVNSTLMYIGFWAALMVVGAAAVPGWVKMAARALGDDAWANHSGRSVTDLAWAIGAHAAIATLAAVGMMGLCVLAGLIGQRAIVISPSKLAPDFSRINPIKNARQKFGKSGLVTYLISVGKALLVGVAGWWLFRSLMTMLGNAEYMSGLQWISGIGVILGRVMMVAVVISAMFAIVDFLWKRFDHNRRNRMTRREMMDEHKDSEGDPHMKASRRQKAVDIVTGQMLADVEKADVVIVNPTHYAVALEWKRGSGRAPVCVAKGVDEMAQRIRERAGAHNVPIRSDPPCARALHAMVDVGEEIQTEHFAAVAAAIRFAEAIRKKAREGWGPGPMQGGG